VSYPLIVDGVVYVIVGWAAPNAGLTAFDARTGARRWGPIDTGEGSYIGGHAYDDGRIFVVNGRGFAQAFDAQSGLPLWANVITDQLECTTPPTAYGGVVTFSGAGEGATFYGVDEATGAFRWQAYDVQGGEVSASAASSAGIFVSYACAQAYGFAPSGTALWYYNSGCKGGGGATPALYGTQLYIRDASGNTVIDVTTGNVLGIGTFVAGPPLAFHGNLGFFISGDGLQAVDMTTNKTVWTFTGDSALVTAPVVAGGYVYVGSASGDLYALSEATGAKAWADAVGSAFVGSPAPGNLDPYASLGAAEGFLVAPAGSTLVVYGP
jgi:outer membrane protein assembly factor BamB